MKKQRKHSKQWPDAITELLRVSELAMETLKSLKQQAGKNPRLQASLGSLSKQLDEIQKAAKKIHQITCGSPAEKFLAGKHMTEPEYYFSRAHGCDLYTAKGLGLSPVDDYEVFTHCCYNDDEMFCYINPAEKPPVREVGKETGMEIVRIRIGRSPEELQAKYLRPEQHQFFEKFLPDVLKRFKTD